MKPKFSIGDKVVVKNDPVAEVHKVLSFSYDGKFVYKVSSRELDIPKKKVVDGISHFTEKELKNYEK